MALRHHYSDRLTQEDQEKTLEEIEQVIRAVIDLGPNPDPTELRKLYAMLNADDRTELEYVAIEEAA